MASQQEVGVSLVAQGYAKFISDMEKAGKSVGDFGETAGKAAGGLSKIGESALKIGGDLAKVGMAAGAAAGALTTAFAAKSVAAFGDFQAAILQTKAVADEWSPAMQKDLEDLALKLGADLPISAKDAALGFSELAKAGFKTNEITKAGTGLANLAVAGQLDMVQSASILAAALNGFQLPAEKANHVADLLAKTANASAVDVSDLGETFKYIAPAAKAAGFSIEDMSIAIGIMGNAGIKGSEAGTALRSTITRLAAPPKDAAAALQALGVSAFDATGKSRPFRDILVELQGKFKGLSEQEAINMAKSIAGQEALGGFLSLVKASPKQFDDMADAIDHSDGAASKMAGTMSEGFNGAVENLKGTIESFLIKAGRPLGDQLEVVLRKASDLVNALTPVGEAFGQKLANAVKTTMEALEKVDWAGIVAKITPIVNTVMSLTSALNPLGIAIELISGILSGNIDGALANIGKRFETVGALVDGLAPSLLASAGNLLTKLVDFVAINAPKLLTSMLEWGKKLVEWVAPMIPPLLEAAGKLLASLGEWALTKGIPFLVETFSKWGAELWVWVEKSWPNWLKVAGEWLDKIMKWLGDQIPVVVAKLAEWGKAFVQWVIDSLPDWYKKAAELLSGIIDWVGKQTPAIGKQLGEWANAFVIWITRDVLPQLPGLLMNIVNTVANFLKDNLPKIIKIGSDIGGGLMQGILRAVPGGGVIADAYQAVGSFLNPDTNKRQSLEQEFNQNRAKAEAAYKSGQISVQAYQSYLTRLTEAYQKQLAEIPGYASGTEFAPGGWSVVGERGAELINLPYGSQVVPLSMSAQQIGQMGNTYNYSSSVSYGGNTYNNTANNYNGGGGGSFEQFYAMNVSR